MKSYKIIIVYLLFLFNMGYYQSFSQVTENRMTKQEYINMYKDIAIEEMNTYGIPASITLAQGILESGHGHSELAKNAMNHFGIKCHKVWTGKTYLMDDDTKNECFRKYQNPYDSYKDHSAFLTSRERYNFLFDLEITDYKAWAKGLKKAGYATNPKYSELLIRIIEIYDLHKYDEKYIKDLANRNNQKIVKEVNDIKAISSNENVNIFTWQVNKYNEQNKE